MQSSDRVERVSLLGVEGELGRNRGDRAEEHTGGGTGEGRQDGPESQWHSSWQGGLRTLEES